MDGGRRLAGAVGWPQWSFLGSLPQGALAALFAAGTQREFAAGSTLLMEGDSGTDVIILIDGWAKVVGLTAYGGRALLALCLGRSSRRAGGARRPASHRERRGRRTDGGARSRTRELP